jgi:hypothetical protein
MRINLTGDRTDLLRPEHPLRLLIVDEEKKLTTLWT